MCGLVAVVGADALDQRVAGAIGAMTDVIAHRGPDAGATHLLPNAALGHRRLAIIDIATGAQPMSNEDGSVWVIFNGEIYNYHPVRDQLEARGHRFRTVSDTETIVHAFEEWGPACVERLDGMFAFVVHDARTNVTFAARDRLGKKPLFHAVLGGQLHLASELKSIKKSPLWTGDLDEDVLDAYLALGYIPAPRTAYRGVSKLLPGHWLRHDRNGLHIQRYWDVPSFDADQRDESAVLDSLDTLFAETVRNRLESEVPLGAFLSGGIDSGLVVSYMAEDAPRPPVTLTVGFSGDPANELAAARATASALGTEHHDDLVTVDLDAMLGMIARAVDEPFADSSAIPTFAVCGAARQHVTVALSGDGGDETFAGYDFRYAPHATEQALRRRLGPLTRPLAAAAAPLWPRSRRLPRPLRLYNTLANLSGSEADAFYRDLLMLKPEDHATLRGRPGLRRYRESWAYSLVHDAYQRCPSPDAVQRAQYADVMVYMPNDPLVKVDRMSMQHGLEVRCPMLDSRLVEFAFSLPTRTKLPGKRSKHLLRRLAERRLPKDVVNLPKLGFTAPVATWFRGKAGLQFSEEVLRPGTWVTDRLSLPYLRTRLDSHRTGREDNSYLLWAVWMLHRWREHDAAGVCS
jgi:asparagine synthase (glutamine-hydrolysing)